MVIGVAHGYFWQDEEEALRRLLSRHGLNRPVGNGWKLGRVVKQVLRFRPSCQSGNWHGQRIRCSFPVPLLLSLAKGSASQSYRYGAASLRTLS